LDVLHFLEGAKGMIEMWSTIPYNASLVDRVDIVVNPKHEEHVKSYLTCAGMTPTVVEKDLQKAIDQENQVESIGTRDSTATPDLRFKRGTTFSDFLRGLLLEYPEPQTIRQSRNLKPSTIVTPPQPEGKCGYTGMNWYQYHRYNTINSFIKCLAAEYPDKATMFTIGQSWEGRDLTLLRITNNPRIAKTAVWIDGGIHAREWASPSAVTYMMQEFLENSDNYKHVLDNYDLYILPLSNPDGYEYSHTKDRLWRKTRSNHKRFGCVGVDPNRNWGYHWGGQGASGDPCDETYYGPKAFSEPETNAIKNFIMARKGTFRLYLTFHSYGQYILYPWGYARRDTPDRNDLHSLGLKGAQAAKSVNGRRYSVGTAAKMLYPAAGGSDDWAKGGAGIKYSYTVELPDTGRHGFLLPASKTLGSAKEALALTEAMITNMV